MWEANAIMRYICDKYDLHPQFYLSESGSLKTRTDMGLDWYILTSMPVLT